VPGEPFGLAAVCRYLPELVDAATVVVLPAVGGDVAPTVGLAPISVGEAIGVGELASADDRSRPTVGVVGSGEGGDPLAT
jgi:hypothetical protein